jgi:flagellar biosynthesis/type III secretory pathway chaperone
MSYAAFSRYVRCMVDGDDGTTLEARRVAVAQRIIAEQKSLIDHLKAARRDAAGAERLLRSFEEQLRRAHLLRSFEELRRLTRHVS